MNRTPNYASNRLPAALAALPAFSAPRRLLAGLLVAAFLAVLAFPGGAVASNALRFNSKPKEELIFSTRARIKIVLFDESDSPVQWHGEYAAAEGCGSPSGCQPPPGDAATDPAAWKLAGGSNEPLPVEGQELEVALGHEQHPGQQFHSQAIGIVHHLIPSTVYFARFTASDEAGEVTISEPFIFTTDPPAPPEVLVPPVGPNLVYQPEPGKGVPRGGATSPTSACFSAQVETNGSPSTYAFEYATSRQALESGEGTHFSGSGATGSVTVAEDFAVVEACTSGLAPETEYFAGLRASNEVGGALEAEPFKTPTDKPQPFAPQVRNITGTSAYLTGSLLPHGAETDWRFEYATTQSALEDGQGTVGPAGVVSQSEAEALPENTAASGVEGRLTGLEPDQTYYVRLFAENERGAPASQPTSFKTFGPPRATTLAVHTLAAGSGSLRILGAVDPDSLATSAEQLVSIEGSPTGGSFKLSFEGEETGAIAADAPAETVRQALGALSAIGGPGEVSVTGRHGGPYTVYFAGALAAKAQPLLGADGSALTPAGQVRVETTQPGGEGYDTHYYFEYEPTSEDGPPFSHAASTPAVDLGVGQPADNGTGAKTEYVGATLLELQPGETYSYRLAATSTSPGGPVAHGEEQLLSVPAPASASGPSSCPNQDARTGPSSALPDCRAYELLTPPDKEGAQEIFNYGGQLGDGNSISGPLPAADGDHLIYENPQIRWGSEASAGQSPYLFSRTPSGWRLTAGTPQPEAGLYNYAGQVFSPDLTQLGVTATWGTSSGVIAPKDLFKVGPLGGPMITVASVPPAAVQGAESGWVAASADFSKLVLALEDRTLTTPHSTTATGEDLYEYSGGTLRQLNVDSAGHTIGSCGARMVDGQEGQSPRGLSSLNALSAGGSRVFFEAAPGSSCPDVEEVRNGGPNIRLYMRTNGVETTEIGEYHFLEADPSGSTLLLADPSGDIYRYQTANGQKEAVSPDATLSGRRFYAGTLGSVSTSSQDAFVHQLPSSVTTELRGFGEGETEAGGANHQVLKIGRELFGTATDLPSQAVLYDSSTHLLQCLACASTYDPEPALVSVLGGSIAEKNTFVSENGNYAFFDTPAALLRADVDGELAPEKLEGLARGERTSDEYSLSSDVYEWRRQSVDGCEAAQGCLALITSGRGGYLDLLLGTAHEGRDVFFAARESLLPGDRDTSSDIYDARIGGGFPEPSRPVECGGDACFHPAPAPEDATPGSLTYSGPGNERPHKHRHHRKKHRHHHHKPARRNKGGHK